MRTVNGFLVTTVVLVILISSSGFISVVFAQAGQVTLNPTDNTYVDFSLPNSNYGGQNYLQTAMVNLTFQSIVWLKFNLSNVPDGAVIDGATLSLHAHLIQGTLNVHAYSCSDNSWTEFTLTYSNMPSYNTTSMDSVLVATSNQWYNWSVVDAVRNALSDSSKSVTIIMQEPTPNGSVIAVWFESKESTVYSPTLTVHWSGVVPEFPSFLILLLFMIVTLPAVIAFRRKRAKFSPTCVS